MKIASIVRSGLNVSFSPVYSGLGCFPSFTKNPCLYNSPYGLSSLTELIKKRRLKHIDVSL